MCNKVYRFAVSLLIITQISSFSYSYSSYKKNAPSGSIIQEIVQSQRGALQHAASKEPASPIDYPENDAQKRISILSQTKQRTEHTFSELNKLSYKELVDLIVTIEWSDIPGLFEFSPGSYEFFIDSNRVKYLINAISDRGARFTSQDHLGIPTLIEVVRAGFFLGFYHDELIYLRNSKPFINHLLPALESIVNNPNLKFGTGTQDDVIKAFGYLMSTGAANLAVVNKTTPLLAAFNADADSWLTVYDKTSALYTLLSGIDYALISVQLYHKPGPQNHPYYNAIDPFWDEIAKLTLYGTLNEDYTWLITNAVWWAGRIGQFVVKPKQIQLLTDVVDLYGKWPTPSLEAVRMLDLYYPDDNPFNMTEIKKEVHSKLLPNYHRFDNGTIIFNVGDSVSLQKVKTLYWAIKEVKAQFHRYTGSDKPLESGHPDDSLTAIVYSTPADYTYNNFLYGLGTNNGGMYIEMWGTFFTYERKPNESIYTLEDLFRHEYTHFLQSRYIAPGFWGSALWSSDRLTWFEEGGAEFTAGSSRNQGILYRKTLAKNIDANAQSRMTLPQVLAATYSSGFTFYNYACVFLSYMHETRMDILNKFIGFVQANDGQGYDAYIAQLKTDAALSAAYNNYMQQLVNNTNSFVDPVTSADYLVNIPDGNLNDITAAIKNVAAISNITTGVDSSAYCHTYYISCSYTVNQSVSQQQSWNIMDSLADTFLDKLDDLSWTGYKTVTSYFTDYTNNGNSFQYDVVFRGILKQGMQSPISHFDLLDKTMQPNISFRNPYIPGSIIYLNAQTNDRSPYTVSIFDISGKLLIRMNVKNSNCFIWPGKDLHGNPAANGFYILSVNGGDFMINRKLLLSK